MQKKEFALEDIYSILVMIRDIEQRSIVNQVFRLYFKEGAYPIRVFVQMAELEGTSDIEMEISAYRGKKQFIKPTGTEPQGPFSPGVVVEDFVHCSGVLPLDPRDHSKVKGGFEQEIRQCLENLQIVLEAADTNLQNAYAFVVYLTDLEKLPQVEKVFLEYFSPEADILQEVVKVDRLVDDYSVEISCSAFRQINHQTI